MSSSSNLGCDLLKMLAVFIIIAFVLPISAVTQSFHKTYQNPENLFTQRILRNQDGSYFIGDSYLMNGEIYISRFFKCGALDWSFSYQIEEAFVEFRDFALTSNGDLVTFGSYFLGNSELIFVQKVNPISGVQKSFNTFDPGFQDHFTYSIDIKNGEILLYGLLSDFNIERRGFLVGLDERMTIDWAKSFTPFEKEGHAVIGGDGYYLRSEKFHLKFNFEGELVWSRVLTSPDNPTMHVSGPIPFSQGNIYEATINGKNFFYELDLAGNLLWTTDLFFSTGDRSELTPLSDGNFLVSYYGVLNGETVLAQMNLSASGQLDNQTYFNAPEAFAAGAIQVSLFEDLMTIVGSPAPFSNAADANQDFVLQVATSEGSSCYPRIAFNDLMSNNTDLKLEDYQVNVFDFDLQSITGISISFDTYESGLALVCSDFMEETTIDEIFELECGENIDLNLPSSEYRWDDLHDSQSRKVSEPGTYVARSENCEVAEILTFTIESPDCACSVYFPTAFSPNDDGFNDEWEYYSDCEISSISINIYNRWGEKVFENNVVGQFWRAESASTGVYIIRGEYEVVGPNGLMIKRTFTQSITVLN